MRVTPITLREARVYVGRVHRHHKPPQGGLFAIAASEGDEVVGVVIVGRPIAQRLDDGWTVEVTRLATDGSKNACSMLYRAAWRAARAMGYQKLITYTLPEEGGTSLRAAGFTLVGQTNGDTWNRPNGGRPRVDLNPNQVKLRWELAA